MALFLDCYFRRLVVPVVVSFALDLEVELIKELHATVGEDIMRYSSALVVGVSDPMALWKEKREEIDIVFSETENVKATHWKFGIVG